MTDALVVATPRAILTQETLKAEGEQRALLSQYISRHMVEKVDFGKIPGTDKPTLLKPGAEKLVDLFRCTPKFALIKSEEDFDKGFFNYIFRVRLYQRDADAVLAEGYGSANSREGRYRWREAQRKCPKCGKATIFASKHEPGFFCWAKKGGCGSKFGPADKSITEQQSGRVENDDIATLANTILKMAKKRALVDGAIALARCSDLFTQDVEDIAVPPDEESRGPGPVPPEFDGFTADNPPPFTMNPEARETAPKAGSIRQQLRSQGAPSADREAQERQKMDESLQASAALGALCRSLGWPWEKMVSYVRGATSKDHISKVTLADVELVKRAIAALPANETGH